MRNKKIILFSILLVCIIGAVIQKIYFDDKNYYSTSEIFWLIATFVAVGLECFGFVTLYSLIRTIPQLKKNWG